MRKDVLISITGMPDSGDGQPEPIQFSTEGKLFRKNGRYYITYQESALTGMEGITTTMKLEDRQVTLMRNGSLASHMVFQEGEKHWGTYQLEGRTMTVAVSTQRVSHHMGDQGGDVELAYSIEVDHVLATTNTLRMQVRESAAR